MGNNIIKKILIFGLANSGKTSIALSMKNVTDLNSFTSLSPTRGIEITEFEEGNSKFLIWDFGGQERYRSKYRENLKKYISETNEIIYVIDIQDENVYFISVVYLREILTVLKNEGYIFELTIYFHKYDNNFSPNELKIKELRKILEEEIPEGFSYKIYHTKINAVFDKKPSLYKS